MDHSEEESHSDPTVRTRRCDACRLVAARVDSGFDLAEANAGVGYGTGRELDDKQIEQVPDEDNFKNIIRKEINRKLCPGPAHGLFPVDFL